MAIKARSKAAPEWYAPESEYDVQKDESGNVIGKTLKADATRFKIRPLAPAEKEAASEYASNGAIIIPPKNFGLVLRFAVSDWDNFLDERGKPMKFSVTNLEKLPGDVRIDLASEILTRSMVTEEEEKN